MTVHGKLATRALVIVTMAMALVPLAATAEAQTGMRHRRSFDRAAGDISRQQQQIRRTRVVTRRILRDRRASEEMKQQAAELDTLLDKRQQIYDRLETRHREFAAQHKADIEELDDRLSTARKDVLESTAEDVAALKDASMRAADLADALRARYVQERRGGRRAARDSTQ
jgi:hypothetical protein